VALVDLDSVLIAFVSSGATTGAVEYGLDAALGSTATSPGPVEEHAIRLTGLVPGTRYQYRILVGGVPVGGLHSFATVPADPAAPLRCAVLGDCGSGGARQLEVAARMLAAAPDLVLITGDVVYESGTRSEIGPKYFEPYANLIDHIPFYPSLGNHDFRTEQGLPLLEALYLPTNDEDGTERYYSFDRGDVHIVALDSNWDTSPGSPQRAWLDRDLTRSTATWTFVYFHHPPYSSSSHGSDLSLRQDLGPLFDAHGVDIVFNGHDHNYERTFPLRAGVVMDAAAEPDYVRPGGTMYIVTGGGGRSLYPSGTSSFTAESESTFHFVQVDIDGASLVLTAIRADGTILDRMTLTR
jgi:hypothetical protein